MPKLKIGLNYLQQSGDVTLAEVEATLAGLGIGDSKRATLIKDPLDGKLIGVDLDGTINPAAEAAINSNPGVAKARLLFDPLFAQHVVLMALGASQAAPPAGVEIQFYAVDLVDPSIRTLMAKIDSVGFADIAKNTLGLGGSQTWVKNATGPDVFTPVAGVWTWDGTATVLVTDTSGVIVGDKVKPVAEVGFTDVKAAEFPGFVVLSIATDVSVTLTIPPGAKVPVGKKTTAKSSKTGTAYTIKTGPGPAATAPGEFLIVDFDDGAGGAAFRRNIGDAKGDPNTRLSTGDDIIVNPFQHLLGQEPFDPTLYFIAWNAEEIDEPGPNEYTVLLPLITPGLVSTLFGLASALERAFDDIADELGC